MTRWLRLGGLLLACMGLLGALTLPRYLRERALPNIIAIVDITQSMNVLDEAIDERPLSRLALVKTALMQAVRELPCGSKLGLGIFTEFRSVVLLMPVETCINRAELLDAIDGIDGRMAWAGGSEIAKGVYLTVRMLRVLEHEPALAFITDGHEAPPIDPHHRIDLGADSGLIRGLIVGVGGSTPAPIPRVDPEGNPAGFWGHDDVMQESLFAHGRQGSVSDEAMADERGVAAVPVPPALLGTPGQEQLSFLHEPYLMTIAAEAKLAYARLSSPSAAAALLNDARFNQPQQEAADLRWLAAAVALVGLCLPHAWRVFSRGALTD